MNILDNALPILQIAGAATTGVGVPGLEAAVNGVLALAEMAQVCGDMIISVVSERLSGM
jgi:hypothetical protein